MSASNTALDGLRHYTKYTSVAAMLSQIGSNLSSWVSQATTNVRSRLTEFATNRSTVFLAREMAHNNGVRHDIVGMSLELEDATAVDFLALRLDNEHCEVCVRPACLGTPSTAGGSQDCQDFQEIADTLKRAITHLSETCDCEGCDDTLRDGLDPDGHLLTLELAHCHPTFGNPGVNRSNPNCTVSLHTSALGLLSRFGDQAFTDDPLNFKDMRAHAWKTLSGVESLLTPPAGYAPVPSLWLKPVLCTIRGGDADEPERYWMLTRRYVPMPAGAGPAWATVDTFVSIEPETDGDEGNDQDEMIPTVVADSQVPPHVRAELCLYAHAATSS